MHARRILPLFAFGLLLAFPDRARAVALDAQQKLGRQLYRDHDLSLEHNQSCATCHSLRRTRDTDGIRQVTPGFVDPKNTMEGTAVSRGSSPGKTGFLNSPSAGYAAFSPAFHFDEEEGLYVGGQFWNGRATNLADQASRPFVTAHEMAMPSHWAVVTRLQQEQRFVDAFQDLYGIDLAAIPPNETAPASETPPAHVEEAYTAMTEAIAAFEKSRRFNRFTSKLDFVLAGMTELTPLEQQGREVFESETKGNCAACHPTEMTVAPNGAPFPPLLTDFTYDNIGLPRNVNIPGNPDPDPGLHGSPAVSPDDPDGLETGKHKVMSLRNIAVTAPYGHNGVFATLEEIVHFYNTRDTLGVVADNNDPGFAIDGWPAPEVPENVNTDELGDLGLSAQEETALVAFLKTFTDNYPRWGNDPKVPRGTRSPYQHTPFPEFP